jgi:molybdopterin adenylyltransferase
MSQSTAEHRAEAPHRVRCAVITVSDTRTLATDRGGPLIADRLAAAGHEAILKNLGDRADVDAILMTGGTGVGRRDQTFETVSGLLEKSLPGYGELFRMLSFEQVGPAAMLSRAIGGLMAGKILLTMPGSPAAVQLAMDRLIVPELGHLVREARK